MKRLLVVGNGFDVAHGMPSRYSDFKEWLEDEYGDLIDRMSEYFPDVFDDDLEWWNDFENNLDVIDARDKISEMVEEYYPDFGSDDFRDSDYHAASIAIEDDMKELYRDIQTAFENWIETIGIPTKRKFLLDDFDFFLTFNYTDTLQSTYGVSDNNVLHIHGRAGGNESLVIGHNANPDHFKDGIDPVMPAPPADLLPHEKQEWYEAYSDDYIAQSTRYAAEAAVHAFKKPTVEIIDKYRVFFGLCHQLEEISFYGFSFAPVDMPYVKQLASHASDSAVWNIYCYSEADFRTAEMVKSDLASCKFKIQILKASEFPSYESKSPLLPGI